jgi:deoxyribose-phosphate aldolase
MEKLTQILALSEKFDHELPPLPPLPEPPEGSKIASWIDQIALKPDLSHDEIQLVCEQAREHRFACVCVNSANVPLVAKLMAGSNVNVGGTVGFPLGAALKTVKIFETLACMEAGATEIDMVMNIGALKSCDYGQVLNEMQAVADAVHHQNGIVKVILETALLNRREKIIACMLAEAAGMDFVKTSTGFGSGGAKTDDVELMYRIVGPKIRVKAAGGIKDYTTALAMIHAGATRLGASAGVQILLEAGR